MLNENRRLNKILGRAPRPPKPSTAHLPAAEQPDNPNLQVFDNWGHDMKKADALHQHLKDAGYKPVFGDHPHGKSRKAPDGHTISGTSNTYTHPSDPQRQLDVYHTVNDVGENYMELAGLHHDDHEVMRDFFDEHLD